MRKVLGKFQEIWTCDLSKMNFFKLGDFINFLYIIEASQLDVPTIQRWSIFNMSFSNIQS